MLETNGVVSTELVNAKFDALLNNPKKSGAILECYQEIPCNPCSTSCPFDAIQVEPDINQKPVINYDKCTSCGICVYNCPGLAIFVVDANKEKTLFKISYELLPIPEKGDVVQGVNRAGEVICDATVVRVQNSKVQENTVLLHVEVDPKHMKEFVTVRV